MTISQAHTEFKFRYGKFDALNYPDYLPEEIDLILNQAQESVVKQRYGLNNLKKQSFEETQKRMEDLKELIRTKVGTISSADTQNVSSDSYNVTLESDHWFTIWEKAIINCPTCNSIVRIPILTSDGVVEIPPGLERDSPGGGDILAYANVNGIEVEVRPTTHLELEKVKKDAFKKPDRNKILRLMFRSRVELIPPTECRVVSYIYRYIKKPTPVNIDTGTTFELSEHLHSEIIDAAVNIALEGTEAKRLGTFKQFIDNLKE